MDERNSRLCTHQKNIEHYKRLLETKLNEIEQQYLERRLSEERFAIAMLDFMSPPKAHDGPRVHE
jgi:predicted house-cleaning noncanonical NTP pyrophosphatase (MazG superfamily)